MRIALAADERTGVADALAAALADRGHQALTVAPVLIDARAAVRAELGGVERWARELSVRLPALDPERYAVARPPRALAHRAGHFWEQLVLPASRAGRGARAILCPANLAPLASRRTVVVLHDVAPLREPAWYSDLYVRWQRAVLPRIAQRAALVLTPSAFSRDEVVELLDVSADRVAVVPGGVDDRFTPSADPGPARAAYGLIGRPYVLTVASRTVRKNLGVLDLAAGRLAATGRNFAASGTPRASARSVTSTTRCCPASTRALPPLCCHRYTRALASPRWRRWPPASRSWLLTAAHCPRSAAEPLSWWTQLMLRP